MSEKKEAEISEIQPNSIAAQLGVEIGDKIISINGEQVNDLIDYRYLCAEEYLEISLLKKNGETWILEIEKELDEDLGIYFTYAVFDRVRLCQNKCLFCFVDQMPPNMRPSLYVKDDDYRLSFLQGNFITLTNLKEHDLERISRLKLSPLYVSVHTLDESIRKKTFNTTKAVDTLKILQRLIAAGIQLHTQIVLAPELNDGQVLEKTVATLSKMFPHVISLAVVPVGLTRYRQGLARLRTFNEEEAQAVLDFVTARQQEFLSSMQTRLIFASDELYFLAGRPVPEYKDYEDFCQLENGVGLTRLFWHQVTGWLSKQTNRKKLKENKRKIVLVTGKSGKKVLEPVVKQLADYPGIMLDLVAVENCRFGPLVTVTGLLTGEDIIRELARYDLRDKIVFVPTVLFRESQTGIDEESVFLDDMSLNEFRQKVKTRVVVVETSGDGLLNSLASG